MSQVYLHLSEFIEMVCFEEQSILLDLKKDKFYIFDEVKTNLLKCLLEETWRLNKDGSYDSLGSPAFPVGVLRDFIDLLQSSDVLAPSLDQQLYPLKSQCQDVCGMDNIDWRLPLNKNSKTLFSRACLKALYVLTLVHLTLKFRGLYALVSWVRKTSRRSLPIKAPMSGELSELVETLNHACRFYSKRTKCLEWATTLTLLAFQKGWPVTLNVGVQNYPFLSHAWCQLGEEVIADSSELPKRMAIILKVPDYRGNEL